MTLHISEIHLLKKNNHLIAAAVAQWILVLSIKSNDLGLVPRTHRVEGKNLPPQVVH